jgi:uncharacterized membrane protein
MSQQTHPTSLPWLFLWPGRTSAAALAIGIGALATRTLPVELQIVVSFDLGALVYLALFYLLMSAATPEQCADLSQRWAPAGALVAIAVVLLSVVTTSAIGAMLNSQSDKEPLLRWSHLIASLFALVLSWLLVHVLVGLHYMRVYYKDWRAADRTPGEPHLDFPVRPMPDLWDFMYYSFTIAMCYQTSDVTINSLTIRRMTLLHAIFSFLYIVAIIGFVVNVLSSVL